MKKGNWLMAGYESPSEQEEVDYRRFRDSHLPSLEELEVIASEDAPASMSLYVLTGRRMKLR